MDKNITEKEEFFVVEHASNPSLRIIYCPLRSYLALVPREVGEILLSPKHSRLKDSFLKRITLKPKIDMVELLENLHRADPELSLAITDNCNLRCVYCHASAGDPHKKRTMSKEVIRSVLDAYFSCTTQKVVNVNFNGGGEPTFAFWELDFAIQYAKKLAKERGRQVSFAMATNGCYGDKIRKFIVKNFRSVSLSFDGPAFIHDRHRPMASGKGSFRYVYDTAKFFIKNNFPFAFRATVSSFSLPYLKNIIDFIAEEFPGKSIGLEHLNPFGRAQRCIDPDVRPPDKQKFAEAISQLLQYARSRNVIIMNSATTEYNVLRPVFCSNVGIPNWTVTTSGKIVACGRDNAPDEFNFGYFNPKSGKIDLDNEKIKRLRLLNVLQYPECKDCFCKYHCAGDCPDRRLADKSDCNAIRHIARQVLTNIAEGIEKPKCGVTDTGLRN